MNKWEAFSKTVVYFQEHRKEDWDQLTDAINLDQLDLEIQDGELQSSPAVSDISDYETRKIYQGFLQAWRENMETGSSQEAEKVGSKTDFIVGLTDKRRS